LSAYPAGMNRLRWVAMSVSMVVACKEPASIPDRAGGGEGEVVTGEGEVVAGEGEGEGEVVAGEGEGEAIPLALLDNAWTPHRDDAGRVLQSDWQQLPLMRWLTIEGEDAQLETVAWRGTYTHTFDGTTYSTTDGYMPTFYSQSGQIWSDQFLAAWTGATFDPVTKKLFMIGGGHFASTDNAIYAFDVARLRAERINDPTLPSEQQFCDENSDGPPVWQSGVHYSSSVFPNPDGSMTSGHTWSGAGLLFVPGAVVGNTNGALSRLKQTWGLFDLDTRQWRQPLGYHKEYGLQPYISGATGFSYAARHFWIQGGTFTLSYVDWDETEDTDWSSSSVGRRHTVSTNAFGGRYLNASTWNVQMNERREFFACATEPADMLRIRYGDAVDAGALSSSWDAFTDSIAFTSDNGTDHLLLRDADEDTQRPFYGAGATYDAIADALYVQSNAIDAPRSLYRIDDLDSSLWRVTELDASNPQRTSNGVRGRLQIVSFDDVVVLVMIAGEDIAPQVLRLR
jgi:hypothetical protein